MGRTPACPEAAHYAAGTIDTERIAAAVHEILAALGEDPERPGLERTPARVAALFADLFGGRQTDPATLLQGDDIGTTHDEVVLVRDIVFTSFCEHHFLPFRGHVHLAYLPGDHVAGIGSLARVVDVLAGRLQVQERLTAQIADAVDRGLRPRGVAVLVEAEHLCMALRGAQKEGAQVVTSAFRGVFAQCAEQRREFLALARTVAR